MKRKLLAVVLLGVMATAVLTGCGAEKEEKETTVAEVETDTEVVTDEDEDVSTPVNPEEDVKEVESIETETVTYEATNGQTVVFEFPEVDNTMITKLEDAGIAETGKYTGTYIHFFNEEEAMICMKSTNPNAFDFGLIEEQGTITDEEYNTWAEGFRAEVTKYLDGKLTAIDVSGDGKITYADQAVCAVFTYGQDFYGTTDLY